MPPYTDAGSSGMLSLSCRGALSGAVRVYRIPSTNILSSKTCLNPAVHANSTDCSWLFIVKSEMLVRGQV
jgi:hypothetical protein